MREEDLIPDFCYELKNLAKKTGIHNRKTRAKHLRTVREIEKRMEQEDYFESDDASYDLNEDLFDALNEYAGPYFYFGSHPGNGSDYGFWLTEFIEDEFDGLKVSDSSEIPAKYRGEVLIVNDHGNTTLAVKTSRALKVIWAIV
jgi:hypothetical protein